MQSKTEPTPTGCGGFWIFWKKCRDVVLWCLFIYGQGDHKGSPLRTNQFLRWISRQLRITHYDFLKNQDLSVIICCSVILSNALFYSSLRFHLLKVLIMVIHIIQGYGFSSYLYCIVLSRFYDNCNRRFL